MNSGSYINLRFGILLLLLAGCGEASSKEQWYLTALLSQERAAPTPAPLALHLKPVNSVSPIMSLALFELLSLHWNPE